MQNGHLRKYHNHWIGKFTIFWQYTNRTIKYHDEFNPALYKWGYQLRDDEPKHEWFKLGLYPEFAESGLARRYPSRTAFPSVYGTECEKLVTGYLRALRKYAETHLTTQLGEVFLRNRRPEYIITVPAVWFERAQSITRVCAESAGMGSSDRIQIFTEPEAAGIYALKSMRLGLSVGDTFVLCEAGGG